MLLTLLFIVSANGHCHAFVLCDVFKVSAAPVSCKSKIWLVSKLSCKLCIKALTSLQPHLITAPQASAFEKHISICMHGIRSRLTAACIDSVMCFCCMQMVLPLDVDLLVSNSLNLHSHNQQLLEMVSAGTAVVVPAWEATTGGAAGQQIATDTIQGKLAHLSCLHIESLDCAVHTEACAAGDIKTALLLQLTIHN